MLPKGWELSDLGHLGSWKGGGTPSKANAEYWSNGSIPWVSPKDMKSRHLEDAEDHITPAAVENSSTSLLKPGSMLIVTRSGILRRLLPVAINRKPVAINQDIKALEPNAAGEIDYIRYFVESHSHSILQNCAKSGTTVESIDFDRLKSHPVPIPPKAEQRRIVAKLDALNTRLARARDQLNKIPRLVEKYKQEMLASAFHGQLSAEWRENNISAMLYRELGRTSKTRRGVPAVVPASNFVDRWRHPKSWQKTHVGAFLITGGLVDVKDGNHGTNHPKRDEFAREGLPFITAAQLAGDQLDTETAPRLAGNPLRKLNVGFAKPGDVLLSHKGTVGRAALCNQDCILSPQTTYYRLADGWMNPSFLRMQFLSAFFKVQLDEVKSQTTRDFVPISAQYELFLLRPPLEEQEHIVRILDAAFARADRLEAEAARARELLDRLEAALLAKAFRGELVPQDPADEPASVLLDRIRTERAAAPKAKRRRQVKAGSDA